MADVIGQRALQVAHVRKKRTGTDGSKLEAIAEQNHFGSVGINALEQIACQADIDHGRLVNHNDVSLKRIVLARRSAVGSGRVEQTVQRLGFQPHKLFLNAFFLDTADVVCHSLLHARGSFTGRRGKLNDRFGIFFDQAFKNINHGRGFAGAGPAADHRQSVGQRNVSSSLSFMQGIDRFHSHRIEGKFSKILAERLFLRVRLLRIDKRLGIGRFAHQQSRSARKHPLARR